MGAKVKVVKRKGDTLPEKLYLIEVFKGMRVTMGHFLRNLLDNSKLLVRHYPEVEPEITPRWRGKHRLTTYEDGSIKCVACYMCQTNCPSNCIMIEAGERLDGKDEKMPVRFDIDLAECIYCGFCVEACPKDAIRMDSGIYSLVESDRKDMLISLEQLASTPGAFGDDDQNKGGV